MFGAIPFFTEDDSEFRKSNATDILPDIIADLEIAASGLPVSQAEVGRASRGAANAYLGRAQMFAGNFAAAKAALDQVVNSGQYALNACFQDNFNAATDNSAESVFAVQFSTNDGDPGANNGNYGTRLGFPHSGSPFGCCGFNQPTQDLVNAFKVDASGMPLIDGTDISGDDFVDPRLDLSVGRDDVPFWDHGTHNPTWIRDRNFAGPYSPKKTQYFGSQPEFNSAATPGAWGPQVTAINYNIIRYSDVLLLLAEAEVELGNLERARDLVNQVRSRAGGCAQGPATSGADVLVAIDDPGITWANYAVGTYDDAWTNASAARDAVRLERRIELSQEGHRMYDLRRWGILAQTMNAYFAANNARPDGDISKRGYLSEAFLVEERHNRFPLPSQQVDLSELDGVNMLQQNPGF